MVGDDGFAEARFSRSSIRATTFYGGITPNLAPGDIPKYVKRDFLHMQADSAQALKADRQAT
jgi:hypothetical protein